MSAIERLAEAIGYPEAVPGGAERFTLLVDGGEIVAEENVGRVRLVCKLTDAQERVPPLAACAAGRMLREEAALSCDGAGVFLWQDAAAGSDARALRRLFESFCDSCDWWRARVDESGADAQSQVLHGNEMRILP